MRFVFRAHEWLADHISWVQYPKPRIQSQSGHAHGWWLRWQARPPMNKALAITAPIGLLFVPYFGVYASILWIVFLFAYFRR